MGIFRKAGAFLKFADKLIQARKAKNMTQAELAQALGVSTRAVTGYETGGVYPRRRDTYVRLAEVFGTTPDYFSGEEDAFITEAGARYGTRGMKQAAGLVDQVSALFAGGELNEDDKDAVLQAIMDAYWMAKEKNKKYIPQKYRKPVPGKDE